eukprot:12905139-Prorocentrum_lima.AAC.1
MAWPAVPAGVAGSEVGAVPANASGTPGAGAGGVFGVHVSMPSTCACGSGASTSSGAFHHHVGH